MSRYSHSFFETGDAENYKQIPDGRKILRLYRKDPVLRQIGLFAELQKVWKPVKSAEVVANGKHIEIYVEGSQIGLVELKQPA